MKKINKLEVQKPIELKFWQIKTLQCLKELASVENQIFFKEGHSGYHNRPLFGPFHVIIETEDFSAEVDLYIEPSSKKDNHLKNFFSFKNWPEDSSVHFDAEHSVLLRTSKIKRSEIKPKSAYVECSDPDYVIEELASIFIGKFVAVPPSQLIEFQVEVGKEDKVLPRLETQMNLYKENQNLVVNTLKKLIKIELETGSVKHPWNCSIKKVIKAYNKYIEKESLTTTIPETSSEKE